MLTVFLLLCAFSNVIADWENKVDINYNKEKHVIELQMPKQFENQQWDEETDTEKLRPYKRRDDEPLTWPNPTPKPSIPNESFRRNLGYIWSDGIADKDITPGYHPRRYPAAPVVDSMKMLLTISLPIAICGIMLALFCIIGLRPSGFICNKTFEPDCNVMVQKI